MSQHRSLKSSAQEKQQRSVLSRFERIKKLREKDEWEEGDSFFGLPKVKVIRLKLKKKSKEAPEEEAEGLKAGVEGKQPQEGEETKPAEEAQEVKQGEERKDQSQKQQAKEEPKEKSK